MAEVTANGVRFHVQRLGTARDDNHTVVMMHGMVMDNLSSFYYTLANPVALDHEVILYDQRGHGRSERPPTGYTVADSVADLRALLAELGVDRPVVLVGNSYGGTIGMAYAMAYPDEVRGVLLIEAHIAVEGWGDHMAGSLALAAFGLDDDQVREWLSDQGGRKVNRLARNAEALIYKTSMLDDLAAVPVMTEAQLGALEVPVLALYGEQSDILDVARTVERCVPNCRLQVMADTTHSLLLERTAEVRVALDGLLAALPTDASPAGKPTSDPPPDNPGGA
ncbi:alpha/beta hydrolase [Candidatus Neomicrothrix sp.]|jgi:pimeloyl-ACP methyl ester carboxylesterase|uniref:alpha/beta hydrolase n=1 Tax=Candidatus Neomicrothrix sp. TaxID=2719034 RepID=UPI001B5749E9|nr:alpha/beta hydrolase [Candidatus Microthrix sp.]MBK9558339.1 alpha/beta hydrolase [Candidatus Microthrix sp.]MBL0203683.1 alpha/beta hydrolase [Candidatus Microthrix sp.]MBP7878501.1 alpha/beta hydrolase [Candidatus Microthrix sp.]